MVVFTVKICGQMISPSSSAGISLHIKGVWSDGRPVDEERPIEMNGIKLGAGKATTLPVKLFNDYQ